MSQSIDADPFWTVVYCLADIARLVTPPIIGWLLSRIGK